MNNKSAIKRGGPKPPMNAGSAFRVPMSTRGGMGIANTGPMPQSPMKKQGYQKGGMVKGSSCKTY
jgi:hypothetical protein